MLCVITGRPLFNVMVPLSSAKVMEFPAELFAAAMAARRVVQREPEQEPVVSDRVVTVYEVAAKAFVPANMPTATRKPLAIRRNPAHHLNLRRAERHEAYGSM